VEWPIWRVVSTRSLVAAGACLVIFAAGALSPSLVIAGAVTATLGLLLLLREGG